MRKVSLYRFLIIEAFYSCFQGLVHPITPTLFTTLDFPDYVFGVVFASTAAGAFLFSPLWGRLGDKIGHSRAFSIALPMYAVSQVAFGFSKTPITAIITRFFSGIGGGGAMVVALAYIVNVTTDENRGRIMSYYAAFSAVSMSMGYFIGGVVGNISIIAVFIIQATMLLLASLMTFILIKDPDTINNRYVQKPHINSLIEIKDKLSIVLIFMLVATLLANISSTSFDNSFNYYIKAELGLPSTYNGVIKAVTGIVGLVANFTINIYLIKRTNLKKSVIIVLSMCVVFSLLAPLVGSIGFFFLCSLAYYASNSIYIPIQQVLVMENADENISGVISGIFNSVRSMGMILGSLFSGFFYSMNSKLPFFMAALSIALGAVVCTINYLYVEKTNILD